MGWLVWIRFRGLQAGGERGRSGAGRIFGGRGNVVLKGRDF